MKDPTDNTPRPVCSLKQIIQHRDRIVDKALVGFCGFTPTGPCFDDMVAQIHLQMPNTKYSVVYESLMHLAGKLITPDIIRDTAWRLAGNKDLLQDGIAVPPWTVQRMKEWCPVQVLQGTSMTSKDGRPGYLFKMRFVHGTPTPMIISKWLSRSLCAMLARRIGFTKLRGKRPFRHAMELVRLRMLVLLDPDLTKTQPGFFKIDCSPGLMKWNREIIDLRNRRRKEKPWRCPQGFTHMCYNCPFGYDQCPAAVRPITITDEGN